MTATPTETTKRKTRPRTTLKFLSRSKQDVVVSALLSSSSSSSSDSATRTTASSTSSTAVVVNLSKRQQRRVILSRFVLSIGLVLIGFRLGQWWTTSFSSVTVAAATTTTTIRGPWFTTAASAILRFMTGQRHAAATLQSPPPSPSLRSSFKRFPIITFILVLVLIRDMWRAIPKWAKPKLIDRAIRDTQLLLSSSKTTKTTSTTSTSPKSANNDTTTNNNDIGDIDTLIGKVNAVMNIMSRRIDNDDNSATVTPTATPATTKSNNSVNNKLSLVTLFAYQNLIRQIKSPWLTSTSSSETTATIVADATTTTANTTHDTSTTNNNNTSISSRSLSFRERWYRQQQDSSSTTKERTTTNNKDNNDRTLLQRLPLLLDMADWAYDEDPSGESLKDLLIEQNYTLIKHDQTTLPGYLGHYIAIPTPTTTTTTTTASTSVNKPKKTAVIGIKGTSGLEDFMTDLCGASVEVDVNSTLWNQKMMKTTSKTTTNRPVRAHEGVAIASRRLADDIKPIVSELLVPQQYDITIVGHSLGAAGASLLSIMLLSEIPDLKPSQVQVYAFASPPTLDLQTSQDVSSFTTTIINNNDIIPRFNVAPIQSTLFIMKLIEKKRLERDNNIKVLRQHYRQKYPWWRPIRRWKQKNRSSIQDAKATIKTMLEQPIMTDDELYDAMQNATLSMSPSPFSDHDNDVDDDDPDHLYVPGNVVLLFDSWSQQSNDTSIDPSSIIMTSMDGIHTTSTSTTDLLLTQSSSNDLEETSGKDDETTATEATPTKQFKLDFPKDTADKYVLCTSTAPSIRLLELDSRMIDDHMTIAYRNSLQRILHTNQTNSKDGD